MIKVTIADDHPLVREGIKKVIQNAMNIELMSEAGNAKELLNQLSDELPDIVILDISMPGRSGLDVMKDIGEWYPQLPVLILSIHSEEQMAVRALKNGARGYINKSSITNELVNAIRMITKQKRRYINPKVAEQLAKQIDSGKNGKSHEGLSDREFETMLHIAAGENIKKIAQELSLSAQTVYTYRNRVKKKLNLESNVEITRYAIENNLLEKA